MTSTSFLESDLFLSNREIEVGCDLWRLICDSNCFGDVCWK
jgi:hypothetical protein